MLFLEDILTIFCSLKVGEWLQDRLQKILTTNASLCRYSRYSVNVAPPNAHMKTIHSSRIFIRTHVYHKMGYLNTLLALHPIIPNPPGYPPPYTPTRHFLDIVRRHRFVKSQNIRDFKSVAKLACK